MPGRRFGGPDPTAVPQDVRGSGGTIGTAPLVHQSSSLRPRGGVTSAVVAPFVHIAFAGSTAKTTASSGAGPQWNELVSVPFRAPNNDYSPVALSAIRDAVVISLFDEVAVEYIADDRDRYTTVTRREHRFLGTVSLPFTTLYMNGRVEGELRLQSPASMLGYAPPSGTLGAADAFRGQTGTAAVAAAAAAAISAGGGNGTTVPLDPGSGVHLYVSASIRPTLPQAMPQPAGVGASRTPRPRAPGVEARVMDQAQAWADKYKRKDRNVQVRAPCQERDRKRTWKGTGKGGNLAVGYNSEGGRSLCRSRAGVVVRINSACVLLCDCSRSVWRRLES